MYICNSSFDPCQPTRQCLVTSKALTLGKSKTRDGLIAIPNSCARDPVIFACLDINVCRFFQKYHRHPQATLYGE